MWARGYGRRLNWKIWGRELVILALYKPLGGWHLGFDEIWHFEATIDCILLIRMTGDEWEENSQIMLEFLAWMLIWMVEIHSTKYGRRRHPWCFPEGWPIYICFISPPCWPCPGSGVSSSWLHLPFSILAVWKEGLLCPYVLRLSVSPQALRVLVL